jgi:hypothetical protein
MPTRGVLPVRPIGCCARAASGHAAAAPLSSVMNSRRLIGSPSNRAPQPYHISKREPCALQQSLSPIGSYGSGSVIQRCRLNVRFAPESGKRGFQTQNGKVRVLKLSFPMSPRLPSPVKTPLQLAEHCSPRTRGRGQLLHGLRRPRAELDSILAIDRCGKEM